MIHVGHETSANLFLKISDLKNMRPNLFEIDRRAKTAMTEVGKIYNNIQKFDYKPQYSDIQSQKIFTKVKEHLILKNLDNEDQKRKFLITKKLFDVFLPIDEEEYKLEDLVKQSGINLNQALFKKRKSMLVVDSLKHNKDKNKHKEDLADILKNINDLKETFLHKPKPVKVIKQKKIPIEINKDLLRNLKSQSKNQFSHLDLADEKKEVDNKTISRLSSPKRLNTKSSIRVDSFNNIVTPKKSNGPNDKINEIFNRMMSGSLNTDRKNSNRILSKNSFRNNSAVSTTKKENFKINLEAVNTHDKLVSSNKSQKDINTEREDSCSEKNFDTIKEPEELLQNKYIDRRYSVIISEKSSYESSYKKEKLSMEKLKFDKKESFITDRKISSDYFKELSISIQNSIRSDEKENDLKDSIVNVNKIETKKQSEKSKPKNCALSKSHNKKSKRQSYLKILEL